VNFLSSHAFLLEKKRDDDDTNVLVDREQVDVWLVVEVSEVLVESVCNAQVGGGEGELVDVENGSRVLNAVALATLWIDQRDALEGFLHVSHRRESPLRVLSSLQGRVW